VTSNTDVPDGAVSLRYEFEPTGEPDLAVGRGVPALGQLYIGDTLVGALDMDHSVPMLFGTEGLTCGRDSGSRVAPDAYADDFAFTGTLERVTVDLSGDLLEDSANEVRVAMARQ
jgi:arylsulfatase